MPQQGSQREVAPYMSNARETLEVAAHYLTDGFAGIP
jgi:hypothetical protein